MIDWDKIIQAYETIKNNEMVNRIDLENKTISIYAVPGNNNHKNVIRIDMKLQNNT